MPRISVGWTADATGGLGGKRGLDTARWQVPEVMRGARIAHIAPRFENPGIASFTHCANLLYGIALAHEFIAFPSCTRALIG